ncbi:MAG: transporter [Bacteroidota bacterium]
MKYIFTICLFIFLGLDASAQLDGPRVYWDLPKNLNILSAHVITGNANASVNNLNFINPSATIKNNLYMLTYMRSQPILGRTFYSTLFVPTGDITTTIDIDGPGPASSSSTLYQHGLGDIMWANTINLIGAPGMGIYDYMRNESPTKVYLQAMATFPTGQYDANDPINIGSNQYKLKVGMPIVQRLSPVINGKRTTLEVFPSYTFISDNDGLQGQEVEQEGMFILESHLTRDITRKGFLSLDYSYMNGGDADFISKETGSVVKTQAGQDVHLIGATVGFSVSDHLNLSLTHNQSFSSGNDITSLDGAVTKLTLSWVFHDFQEQFNNFLGN